MKFCLVTPTEISPASNAGWHMITAGIKWLFRAAVPAAEFVTVPMFTWGSESRRIAEACDALVLCGNPRYDVGSHDWLYRGLITEMTKVGVPMIDAWGGAATHTERTLQSDLTALVGNPRNRLIAKLLEQFALVITRDLRAQKANEAFGVPSVFMPCSSWWAANEYGVQPAGEKTERLFVTYRRPANDVSAVAVARQMAKTCRVVSTSRYDQQWCESIGVQSELVYDPVKLLRLYGSAQSVVSYRLHAAIPAASLGARASMVAIDSRAQACDAFGIPWSPSMAPTPVFAHPPADPVPQLKELLCLIK